MLPGVSQERDYVIKLIYGSWPTMDHQHGANLLPGGQLWGLHVDEVHLQTCRWKDDIGEYTTYVYLYEYTSRPADKMVVYYSGE